MKICNQCNREKPQSEFYIDRKAGSKRSGGYIRKSTVYRQPCKECFKKNKRNRYQIDEKFRQKQKDIAKRWAKTIKGKVSGNGVTQRRRAQKHEAVSTLTKEEWQIILNQYEYCCAYCGKKTLLTQDHIIPLSKGGHHTKNNVVPACITCNSKKGVNLWQPLSLKQLKSRAI